MPTPTFLSVLGIAKEAARAAGVAPTAVAPVAYFPVTSLQPQENFTQLPDAAWRGSQVDNYGNIQGVKDATLDFGGPLYADTFGYVLGGLLGDVTVTGSVAPYSHAFSVLNTGNGQPPSFTLTDYDGIDWRQYAGAQFNETQINYTAAGDLNYTAKSTCFGSATTTAPTKSYSAVPLMPAWRGAVTLGGTADTTIISGDVTIKRKVTVEHTLNGAQQPYTIWVGPATVDFKFKCLAEAAQLPYLQFLGGAATTVDLLWTQGAGAAVNSLKLHMSQARYTVGTITRGSDAVEFDITGVGEGNTTDAGASLGYSPIKATIQSAIAAGLYA
jgi:hypothetical protein